MKQYVEKKEKIEREEGAKFESSFGEFSFKPRHKKLLNLVNGFGSKKFPDEKSLFNTQSNGLEEIEDALGNYIKQADEEMELPVGTPGSRSRLRRRAADLHHHEEAAVVLQGQDQGRDESAVPQ